jgi:N-acetylglucosamine-6-phosphate deacetylase
VSALEGSILTPQGWVRGRVAFGARIEAVEGRHTHRPEPPYVLPGFVDLHVHGGGGADAMEGAEAIATLAALHARHGTTSLLPTSVTAPVPEIDAFLDAVREAPATPGAARVVGAHLEGPFLNPGKLGAQPPHAIPADPTLMRRWLERGPVRAVTLAPECDPGGALIAVLRAAGVRPQIAHSLCSYAEARAAIESGCGVTHLFNAMTPLAHRGCGLAGAALAHATWAEVIPDLIHVEPGAILAARRAIPKLYGVTDATAGAGMPDGRYRLGSQEVTKSEGAIRLADGTLAGSALTMDAALRNLVGVGLPLAEASWRLSTLPARWADLPEAGRLARGAWADMVALDEALEVASVHVAGVPVGGVRWR